MNASPNTLQPMLTAATPPCASPAQATLDTVPECWRSECFAEDLAPVIHNVQRAPSAGWASLAGFAIPLASSLLATAVMMVERAG